MRRVLLHLRGAHVYYNIIMYTGTRHEPASYVCVACNCFPEHASSNIRYYTAAAAPCGVHMHSWPHNKSLWYNILPSRSLRRVTPRTFMCTCTRSFNIFSHLREIFHGLVNVPVISRLQQCKPLRRRGVPCAGPGWSEGMRKHIHALTKRADTKRENP